MKPGVACSTDAAYSYPCQTSQSQHSEMPMRWIDWPCVFLLR